MMEALGGSQEKTGTCQDKRKATVVSPRHGLSSGPGQPRYDQQHLFFYSHRARERLPLLWRPLPEGDLGFAAGLNTLLANRRSVKAELVIVLLSNLLSILLDTLLDNGRSRRVRMVIVLCSILL